MWRADFAEVQHSLSAWFSHKMQFVLEQAPGQAKCPGQLVPLYAAATKNKGV
jgi:hypothetical protein